MKAKQIVISIDSDWASNGIYDGSPRACCALLKPRPSGSSVARWFVIPLAIAAVTANGPIQSASTPGVPTADVSLELWPPRHRQRFKR